MVFPETDQGPAGARTGHGLPGSPGPPGEQRKGVKKVRVLSGQEQRDMDVEYMANQGPLVRMRAVPKLSYFL